MCSYQGPMCTDQKLRSKLTKVPITKYPVPSKQHICDNATIRCRSASQGVCEGSLNPRFVLRYSSSGHFSRCQHTGTAAAPSSSATSGMLAQIPHDSAFTHQSGCPVMVEPAFSTPMPSGGCPIVNPGSYDARINMPQSPNAPHPDQKAALDTQRATSSIPIGI